MNSSKERQILELTIAEMDSVSGGWSVTLDFYAARPAIKQPPSVSQKTAGGRTAEE